VTRASRLAAWGVALALMAAYSVRGIEFTTDITNFLPDGEGAEMAHISRELARSDLARTMVLSIGAGETARAVAAAKSLAGMLRAHPEVAWVREGADEAFLSKVYELYFPRRHYFLSDDPEKDLPPLLTDAGLEAQARKVRDSLALPISPLLKRVVPSDPLGAFSALTERMRSEEPPLASHDGVFTTPDGRFAILFLATKHSAFDSSTQRPLLEAIGQKFSELRTTLGDDLVLEQSGANRFSVDAETKIRGDASMISTLSGIGVAALSLLFFRSILSLGIVAVPGLAGLVIALAIGIFAFGRLDGMTVAFGASLIGVTIDYPTHVLIMWSLSKTGETPWQVTRRLSGSLAMAALTTMASFAGLAFTSFRGFRELGWFATLGVAAALAVTLFLLPDLLPAKRRILPVSEGLARALGPRLAALRRRRAVLAIVPAVIVLVAIVALPRLRWHDDLSRISTPDPVLQAEDNRVRQRVANFDYGRFVIALADDPATLLERNEQVYQRLQALVEDGRLSGVRSLHTLLWPEPLQKKNLELLRTGPDLPRRLDEAFARQGFRPGSFSEFAANLAQPPPPLDLGTLRASPVGPLAGSLVVDLGGRIAALTYLRGVDDVETVRAAIAGIPEVTLFEQRAMLNDMFARFRDQTLWLVAIGTIVVYALLLVRYREWRSATAAFLPALLAPVVILSGFALAGIETHLLHAVTLLMVLGMGVDYGIFIVDSARDDEDEVGATLVSCLLCCLTTILSFGTLALSSQPPLRAIGLTTGAGVATALVLAPVSLLLLKVAPRRAGVTSRAKV
jgi:predicted exporter